MSCDIPDSVVYFWCNNCSKYALDISICPHLRVKIEYLSSNSAKQPEVKTYLVIYTLSNLNLELIETPVKIYLPSKILHLVTFSLFK